MQGHDRRVVVVLLVLLAGAALGLSFPLPSTTAQASASPEVFVAPHGTATGAGTSADPLDLATALAGKASVIGPGITIWLRAGTYGAGGATVFTSRLVGAESHPIVVRQYPGERAIVNGGIKAYGAWTFFWGFEITNTDPRRVASSEQRPAGLELLGRGHRAINLLVHNTGHPGIGFWSTVGDGGAIYGCILWGNGRYEPSSGNNLWTRGSGIYAQNQSGTRAIRDVISFRNFTTGIKAYAEQGYANGFRFEGNTVFDNPDANLFVGSLQQPIDRVELVANATYQRQASGASSVQLGYAGRNNQALVENNYFVSGGTAEGTLAVRDWSSVTATGNTLAGGDVLVTSPAASYSWDRNQYFAGYEQPFRFGGEALIFDAWRTRTGQDRNSSYAPSPPGETRIMVRPNAYESGRAHITVFNWSRSRTVSVDLSSVLTPGAHYLVLDAQNFFGGPVAGGVYTGAPIVLPMELVSVAPLAGDAHHLPNEHTAPDFAVFVLQQRPPTQRNAADRAAWLPLLVDPNP